MKIYFFENLPPCISSFLDGQEPPCVASFDITSDMSTFAPRYVLDGGNLIDKYPNKTDEEVANIIKLDEDQKAKELAALYSAS